MFITLVHLSIEIVFDEIVLSIFILLLSSKTFLFDGFLSRFLDDIIVKHLVVVIGTATIYASIIWPLIFEETVPWQPVTQLIWIRYLIKDNLHDWVCHEVIVTTTTDKEISLQELLKLLNDHFVSNLFFIFWLLILRVRIVCTL